MKRSVDRVCVLGVLALLSVPWGCSQLPSTPPSRAAVLAAAKQVISERYPMSALSERGTSRGSFRPALDRFLVFLVLLVFFVMVARSPIGAGRTFGSVHPVGVLKLHG